MQVFLSSWIIPLYHLPEFTRSCLKLRMYGSPWAKSSELNLSLTVDLLSVPLVWVLNLNFSLVYNKV